MRLIPLLLWLASIFAGIIVGDFVGEEFKFLVGFITACVSLIFLREGVK